MNIPETQDLEQVFRFLQMTPADATTHAARIVEYLRRFPLPEFQVNRRRLMYENRMVEYEFGTTGYSINKATAADAPDFKPSQHGGTQCDSENILMIARALEIAEMTVPGLLLNPDDDLRGKLTSPKQHLNTLTELWWLSRWLPGFEAVPNHPLNPNCGKNIDWRLTWKFGDAKLVVNLEVKRRIGDVVRLTQGRDFNAQEVFEAKLQDENGNSKFCPSYDGEINVLGVTIVGEIDHDVQSEAEKWLLARDDLDALLLFSRFSERRSGFDTHIRAKEGLLKAVLNRDLNGLDLSFHCCITAPIG